MKFLKPFFLLLSISFVTTTQAFNIDSIQVELAKHKQNDDLSSWVTLSLSLENYYYKIDETALGEQICDSIIEQKWREPKSKEECSAFFKVNWYKALYLKENGRIVSAKIFYEKALANYEFSIQNNPQDLLYIYPVLGNIYTILGDNDKAILIHKKMISLLHSDVVENDKNYYLKVALTNLAISYESQSKIQLAIATIQKVFDLEGVEEVDLPKVYSNYGKFLFQDKQFFKARKQLFKAKAILEKQAIIKAYDLASIYKTLAFISIEDKELSQANIYFDLAIDNYKKSDTNRNREVAKTYLEKSKINNNKDELLNKALGYLIPHSRLLSNDFLPTKKELFAENTLADIFYCKQQNEKKLEQKLNYFDLYFEVKKLLRTQYLYRSSKKESFENDRLKTAEAVSICYELYTKKNNSIYAEKALNYIENAKSILLFESLFEKSKNNQSDEKIVYVNKRKILIDALINAKINNDKKEIKNNSDLLTKLKFDFDIQKKKKPINKTNYNQFNLQNFKENTLNNKDVLLVILDVENIYYVIVSKNKSVIEKIEKNNAFLENINTYTSSFKFENRSHFDFENAAFLGELFSKNIPIQTEKIYVVTDGVYNNIPFEAFRINDKYFIEKYEIQHIFSANISQNINYKKQGNNKILLFAPIFENDRLKYLKKSETEVNNTLKIISGKSFLREKASTINFLKNAKEFSILHISTHAQLSNKLHTASIDFYDKSLYFSQIQENSFEADLMVLSACETGIGSNQIGEGSMSLSRAFAYSQIPSVISSLWKVNEESSSLIFQNFYNNLSNKISISKSLRKAKQDYMTDLKIADEKKLPYYWASFILVGENQILDIEKNSIKNQWWFYFVGGFAIALGMMFFYKRKLK